MAALKSQLTTLLSKLSPWLLLSGLTLFCWFLASLFWFIIAPPKAVSLPPVAISHKTQGMGLNARVFDIFEKSDAPKTPSIKPQVTPLPQNLILEGVMLASPSKNSSALIGYQGKTTRYRMGEKVANTSFKLVSLDWKNATLADQFGNETQIKLYKSVDLNAGASINTSTTSTNTLSNNNQAFSNSNLSNLPTLPPKINAQTNLFSKPKKVDVKTKVNNMLDQASTELATNPANYLNKMGVLSNGNSYTVTNQMSHNIRRSIGLKPGDQILSVNGQSLGNPQQDAAILKEVKRTGSAEIQVQRGSQVITVRQEF